MSARHFGNPMGGPGTLGASSTGPSRGVLMPRHSILAPESPINAGRAPLESGDLAETMRDRISMGFFLLFLCSIAAFLGTVVAVLRAVWG